MQANSARRPKIIGAATCEGAIAPQLWALKVGADQISVPALP